MARGMQTAVGLVLLVLSFDWPPAAMPPIIMEAEAFKTLAAPMRRVEGASTASGGAYLELPLGAGQGWRGSGLGSAVYQIQVAAAGTYYLWARTRWGDGCTNAFFVTIDQAPRFILGNDAEFGHWHWVRSAPRRLPAGKIRVEFSNHSDGTALDSFLLTNDASFEPPAKGEGVAHFHDGFGGCDGANLGSWNFIWGQWRVAGAGTGANDSLAQNDPQGGLALTGKSSWRVESAKVQILRTAPVRVALLAGYRGPTEFLRLALRDQGERTLVVLEQMHAGEVQRLASAPLSTALLDQWCELALRVTDKGLEARVNGAPALSLPYHGPLTGRLGLEVQGDSALFDNVEVQFDVP